ncbi:hypothetical protein [Pseudonocardia acaciae]|uniref:hypothetical protein n=1 Tax=Pseudonocardia acaciae TaxID=551276 RepID=UPI00048B8B57|nr:hypothetical protein [Pseudonocardia acaciae]
MLAYHAHLGGGVHMDVDLMRPRWWRAVAYGTGALVRPLARTGGAGERRADGGRILDMDPKAALPWVRVAVVDALDRWLQAPLDQALIDAERGVSRGYAALSLPEGPARTLVVGDALRLARRASRELALYLRRLAKHPQPIPRRLALALEHLVEGYRALTSEVAGRDRELTAVLDGWRRLVRAREAGRAGLGRRRGAEGGRTQASPCPARRGDSMIDPRQAPARVFALSADPGSAEVTLSKPTPGAADSVLVRVPAYRRDVDPDVMSRLLVRLVHRETAEPRGHAALSLTAARNAPDAAPVFEAMVPLCGLRLSEVRADVFDVLSDLPPVATDDPLRDVRQAVVFLREWRRTVTLAQLATPMSPPEGGWRELLARLRPGDELLSRLGDERDPAGDDPLALTRGAADLLVAEIAAAYPA